MKRIVIQTVLGLLILWGTPASAAPSWNLEQVLGPERLSLSLQILLFLTVLSLAPALIIMVTSFTRLVVVFSFLRHALGTQQMPPNQVLIALALFLTFFIMAPVWQEIQQTAAALYRAENGRAGSLATGH